MMEHADNENPFDVAFSAYLAGYLHVRLREYERAHQLDQCLEVADKHQFEYLAAMSRCVLDPNSGIDLLGEGIDRMRKVGTLSGITPYIVFLATPQLRAGDIVGALASVERSIAESSYELADRPETLRLRRELQLAQGNKIAAESGFREAIELAKKLEAGTPEVRATTSLARLLRDTGDVLRVVEN
jgi:tetratricopeptide (TPR) repeat protein